MWMDGEDEGGQRNRWIDCVKNDMKEKGVSDNMTDKGRKMMSRPG